MPEVEVFVPVEGHPCTIKPRSAIVGTMDGQPGENRLMIYYEGDIYGHMSGFDEMLLHAADRLLARYPTVARAWVPFQSMLRVAWYDTERRTLDVEEPDVLRAWQEDGAPAPNPIKAELTDLWEETK